MKRYLHVPGLSLLLLAAACSDSGSSSPGPDGGTNEDGAVPGGDGAIDSAMGNNEGGMSADDAGSSADGALQNDASVPVCDSSKAPAVGKLQLETVTKDVPSLVFAAQPPGSGDWYLVQKTGHILLRAAGTTTNVPFLDFADDVDDPLGENDERGLLSIAFPPDFATSNLFYVMLTPTKGDTLKRNTDQVRQYEKTDATAVYKDTLVTVPASLANHNGGTVAFGPDGMLYVGTGDGGDKCGYNKPGAAQDVKTLYGKILRLDPSKKASGYAADGNPFSDGKLVWHYGLRNPFRFNFDSATGDLFIGDVGQDAYEEIDYARAGSKGLNFGWTKFEGTLTPPKDCNDSGELRSGSTHTPPIFVSGIHGDSCPSSQPFCKWISAIGGVVYRGNGVPALKGAYVFGDYRGPTMGALYQCDSGTSPVTAIGKNKNANTPAAPYFAESGFGDLTAIVEGSDGELYFVANKTTLYKVVAR